MGDVAINLFERCALPKLGDESTRPCGRPKVLTVDFFAALLSEHAHITAWFHATFGEPPKSDVQLLNAYFASECEKRGLRTSRIQSSDMKARVKTLRNQLSQARRVSAVPKTAVLTGCIADQHIHVQERSTTNKDVLHGHQ